MATMAGPADRISFHHTLAVWGKVFTDRFLEGCLPALLAPGNIPGMKSNRHSRFNIYTTRADAERMDGSSAIAELRRCIDVCFHVVHPSDEPHLSSRNVYHCMSAFHRAAHPAALREGAFLVFHAPDALFADGSMTAVERRVAEGADVVLMTGIRTVLEDVWPMVRDRRGPAPFLSFTGEELVRAALRHPHPQTQQTIWGSDRFNSNWPSQIFWKDGDDLLIARCWHLHPIAIRPRAQATIFQQSIDGDYLDKAIDDGSRVHIMQDSAELCFIELSGRDHNAETPHPLGPFDPDRFRDFAAQQLMRNGRRFVAHPIVYKAGPIPAERLRRALDRSERTLAGLMAIIADLPSALPRLTHSDELRHASRLFIYGCGKAGRTVLAKLKQDGLSVMAFLDSHRSGEADGTPILRADDHAATHRPGDVIAIASQFTAEILRTLGSFGIVDGLVDAHPFYLSLVNPPEALDHPTEIWTPSAQVHPPDPASEISAPARLDDRDESR